MIKRKLKAAGRCVTILMALAWANGVNTCAVAAAPNEPMRLRVGVVYNKDLEEKKKDFQDILFALVEKRKLNVEFYLSVGTYDDIVDWYEKGEIDVAVISPGTVARLLRSKRFKKNLSKIYVATYGIRPSEETYAEPQRIAAVGDYPYKYQALCFTTRAAGERLGLKTLDDLKPLVESRRVKFLLIHPMSASGNIFPRYVLKKHGIDIDNIDVEWTYNPRLSIERLREPEKDSDGNEVIKVAFVTDETKFVDGGRSTKGEYHQIDIPNDTSNDKYSSWIPQDIVIYHPKFKGTEKGRQIKRIFDAEMPSKTSSGIYFRHDLELIKLYKKVKRWLKEIDRGGKLGKEDGLGNPSMTLSQVAAILRNYKELHKGKEDALRLALVLSGGGAKCAYQLGAIEALERELKKYKVDIDLVVGTSGGAINALTVALGLSRDEEGQKALRQTWMSFQEKDFLHPMPRVRRLLGFFIGLSQALIIIWLMFLLDQRKNRLWKRQEWWIPASGGMFFAALVEAVIGHFELTPIDIACLIGGSHSLDHVWTVVAPSLCWSALTLTLTGLAILIIGWTLSDRDIRFRENPEKKTFEGAKKLYTYRRWTLSVISIGLVVLCVYEVRRTLFSENEKSLFNSSGIEELLARKVPELLKNENVKPARFDRAGLEEISSAIINRRLLERDLIITGSKLRAYEGENLIDERGKPSDLYFYHDYNPNGGKQAGDGEPYAKNPPVPQDDKRFVSFDYNKSALLDVVIGSSSIYPLFEARRIREFRAAKGEPPKGIELIDGGFIHNSPIEAAMLWKATHVIVIEASHDVVPNSKESLFDKFITAFDYLYNQAQAADTRSRQHLEIFTLKPKAPAGAGDRHSDVLDFTGALVSRAIERGARDALSADSPRFQKGRGMNDQNILLSTSSGTAATR